MDEPNRGLVSRRGSWGGYSLKSTLQTQGEDPPRPTLLCLLFDILSKGLNNNQTA